ncbi:hypothetical protein GGTG_13304 [Gaeumannomyces tritici R3-111a-1]|uniref:Uncharacterized protein n=1 Tax=Gaeumannomyces tritici (strain R3-111a-1) TaxID=644352 RepID=J3PIH6_GAET3|nr:hypothetical protein GGTG_13304 [Gaeumannomyces tritici R3-111a-1]EJT69195.1 hypothetical protein GGTG_13304 [Gaeumannomyces tritici R3-111a-1]
MAACYSCFTFYCGEEELTLAEDVAHLVAHAAHHAFGVALDHFAEDGAATVHGVARLLTHLPARMGRSTSARARARARLELPALGLADHVAAAVQDVAVGADLHTAQLLGVAFDDLADLLALEDDHAPGVDHGVGEGLEGGRLCHGLELVLGDGLGAADDGATVVPDGARLVHALAHEVPRDALLDAVDHFAVAVNDVAALVDLTSLEDGKVDLISHVFGRLTGLLAGIRRGALGTLGSLAGLDLGLAELLFSFLGRGRLCHGLELVLGDGLGAADDGATVVPDGARLVHALAHEVPRDALLDAVDHFAVAVNDVAALVDLTSLEDGKVDLISHVFGRLTGLLAGIRRGALGTLGSLAGLDLGLAELLFSFLGSILCPLLATFDGVFGLLLSLIGDVPDRTDGGAQLARALFDGESDERAPPEQRVKPHLKIV